MCTEGSKTRRRLLTALCYTLLGLFATTTSQAYSIGRGIYDITGPAAELGMLGYAKLDQVTAGIHQRLRARAFVFADENTDKRVVFVSADLPMVTQSIHQGVLKALQQRFGARYSKDNVMLSATHTHSGPGGYALAPLYNITTAGFNEQNYQAIIDGIVEAISIAHANMVPGTVKVAAGDLVTASKNRALTSYQENPQAERDSYQYPFGTTMTLLKLESMAGKPLGMINWFPLHGVSMSSRNKLISGDNKGLASYLFEQEHDTDYLSRDTFVAAFAQANEGDVSPNIDQEEDDPNANDVARTWEAGSKQFQQAKELYAKAWRKLGEGIDYRMAYVDLSNLTIEDHSCDSKESSKTTCTAALGYAFAAGCSDGRGPDIFKEGDLNKLPIIDLLTGMIAKPTAADVACQAPKPILLPSGRTSPIPWTVNILPVQIFRLGELVILGVPSEMTTMSGRRLKDVVREYFPKHTQLVIAGLSNAYSGYTTTEEEYQKQNYEGGHTLFGPMTLRAYQQEFAKLAKAMANGTEVAAGPEPLDLSDYKITLQTPVLFDDVPPGSNFGTVNNDVKDHYQSGEVVEVSFWGGHPKNDLKIQDSYLEVQQLQVDGSWLPVAFDWDWSTTYRWQRRGVAYSEVIITWQPDAATNSGKYRIVHRGNYKNGWDGPIHEYVGKSSTFTLGEKN